jgi:hypothetical protein
MWFCSKKGHHHHNTIISSDDPLVVHQTLLDVEMQQTKHII